MSTNLRRALIAFSLSLMLMPLAHFVGSFWVGIPEVELVGLTVAFVGIALLIFSAVSKRTGHLSEQQKKE